MRKETTKLDYGIIKKLMDKGLIPKGEIKGEWELIYYPEKEKINIDKKYRYCPICKTRMAKRKSNDYNWDTVFENEWKCPKCDNIYGEDH